MRPKKCEIQVYLCDNSLGGYHVLFDHNDFALHENRITDQAWIYSSATPFLVPSQQSCILNDVLYKHYYYM